MYVLYGMIIAFSIIMVFFGIYAIKNENYFMTIMFLLWNLVLPLYFLFIIFDVFSFNFHIKEIPKYQLLSLKITMIVMSNTFNFL